jgi:hypothetical protein
MKNKKLQPPITSKQNIGHHTNTHTLDIMEPSSKSVRKMSSLVRKRRKFLSFTSERIS